MNSELILNNILFSKQKSEELNNLFCDATEPYLFLFCNYEPLRPVSGRLHLFDRAIINRYRLLYDCARYLTKRDVCKKYIYCSFSKSEKEQYRKFIKDGDDFRSVLVHNNSEENGMLQKERIDAFEKWVMSKTSGKRYEEISDDCDAEPLIKALLNEALSFEKLLNKFINNINNFNEKEEFLQTWKKLNIGLCYNNTNIFLGVICDLVGCNKFDAIRYVRRHFTKKKEIEELEKKIKRNEDSIKRLSKINNEKVRQILSELEKENESLNKTVEQLSQESALIFDDIKKSGFDPNEDWSCYDYYIKKLFKDELEAFTEKYLSEDTYDESEDAYNKTLLPQGLIQSFVDEVILETPAKKFF